MQRIFWVYLSLILIGIFLLLLPENGNRIIVINEHHGPSGIDAAGVVLILTCWGVMLTTSIRRHAKIKNVLPVKWLLTCIAAILAGSAWIAIALSTNATNEWIPGAIIATAAYAVVFSAAFKIDHL